MPVSGPHAAMMQPPAGHGALMLTLQGNVLTTGLTPTVRIDGFPVHATFGANFFPLRPGHHRVDVHTQWMRQYGQASMELDIREGATIPCFYAVPWHQFTTGSIGHDKQSRNGLGVMIAMVTIIFLIVTLIVCGCGLGSFLLV